MLELKHQYTDMDIQVFICYFNSLGHIATGSIQVEETSAYCTVNHQALASNYQHEAPGPRFEQAASEVEGENYNHYTTEPPNMDIQFHK